MENGNQFGTIIQIGNCLVSEEVVLEYFSCDYELCKGKCCIVGDCGAPVKEVELEPLERYYKDYSKYMRDEGKRAVDEKGFFEIDFEGDIVTPLVPGTEECAYCHFSPDGACLCSIEKCFHEGKIPFKKPVSCSLYPIRVTNLTGGGLALNLHRWDICSCAFEKGKKEGVRVYQFLRKPLVDIFGEEFYEALDAASKQLSSL